MTAPSETLAQALTRVCARHPGAFRLGVRFHMTAPPDALHPYGRKTTAEAVNAAFGLPDPDPELLAEHCALDRDAILSDLEMFCAAAGIEAQRQFSQKDAMVELDLFAPRIAANNRLGIAVRNLERQIAGPAGAAAIDRFCRSITAQANRELPQARNALLGQMAHGVDTLAELTEHAVVVANPDGAHENPVALFSDLTVVMRTDGDARSQHAVDIHPIKRFKRADLARSYAQLRTLEDPGNPYICAADRGDRPLSFAPGHSLESLSQLVRDVIESRSEPTTPRVQIYSGHPIDAAAVARLANAADDQQARMRLLHREFARPGLAPLASVIDVPSRLLIIRAIAISEPCGYTMRPKTPRAPSRDAPKRADFYDVRPHVFDIPIAEAPPSATLRAALHLTRAARQAAARTRVVAWFARHGGDAGVLALLDPASTPGASQ